MHVVLDIIFAILILFATSFGGLGIYVIYVNRTRSNIHKARMAHQEQEHEAWIVGLQDDSDLFYTGSEIAHP